MSPKREEGFALVRLTLSGSGVEDATITFGDGLNVISGPSDTGKTFILQCIDFLLGARDAPKPIPEAEKYLTAALDIRARGDAAAYRLERAFRGGDLLLKIHGQPDRVLAAQHDADDENNLSRFLLNLVGMASHRIRTNDRGTTRTLSFRDLARLILVDEETIISETSPILTGQYTTKTAEKSVFRLLLTGADDSGVVETPDKKIVRGREEGRNEILGELIGQTHREITALGIDVGRDDLENELERLQSVFAEASDQLSQEQESIAELESRRRSSWTTLRQIESRLDVLNELQARFKLLKVQYSSDLARLEAITEAGGRLTQLPEQRCPVCGALSQHHSSEHQRTAPAPDSIATACDAEAKKIRVLLVDLEKTLSDSAAEADRLKSDAASSRKELDQTANELRMRVQQRTQIALDRVRATEERRSTYVRAVDLYRRLSELESLADMKPDASVIKDRFESDIGAEEAEKFSQVVEALLRDWHFPNLDRVTFSEKDQDILISGVRRGSHGKGVRAITHAAFNIALMVYCHDRGIPHPLFVVIDSPLVVYREPEKEEDGVAWDVKDAFYRSLARRGNEQILIIENEDPPEDLRSNSNIIRFTGSSEGRRGFIPSQTSDES